MQPVMHWGIEVEQRTESQDIYLDCRQMTLFELRRFAHPSLILFEEDHKMRNVAQLVYGDCVRDTECTKKVQDQVVKAQGQSSSVT